MSAKVIPSAPTAYSLVTSSLDMIVLIKYSQKGNKMSDNWLDEYKEGLFSGRIPMRNPKIKKPGDPEYYYYDPRGMDKNAPLKDWKLITL